LAHLKLFIKEKITKKMEKLKKTGLRTGLVLLCFALVLSVSWFLFKPLRVAKAEEYLKQNTLVSLLKASILTPRSPLVHLKLGETYLSERNYPKAAEEYQKSLDYCHNCFVFLKIQLEIKKLTIAQAFEQGDLDKAGDALAGAIEIDQNEPEINLYYGIYLAANGEYQKALKKIDQEIPNQNLQNQKEILTQHLKKIINSQIEPADIELTSKNTPTSCLVFGNALDEIGYHRLAINQFQKATKMDPGYRDAWIYLGKAYLAEQRFTQARKALEKAAEIDPIYPETFRLLGYAYKKLEMPDRFAQANAKAQMLENKK